MSESALVSMGWTTMTPTLAPANTNSDGEQVGAPSISRRGIVGTGGRRSEHRLKLVGRQRIDRRHASRQQRRHHDQPAAAGDGVDKAGEDGGGGEGRKNPGLDHGRGL